MIPKLMYQEKNNVFSPITLLAHAMDHARAEPPEFAEEVTVLLV